MDNGLKRFALAQDDPREGYVMALRELRAGRKLSHWIWYIFPQLRGLGRSEYSSLYGIDFFEEARSYLEDPLLGRRIRNISGVLLHSRRKRHYRYHGWQDGCEEALFFDDTLRLGQSWRGVREGPRYVLW